MKYLPQVPLYQCLDVYLTTVQFIHKRSDKNVSLTFMDVRVPRAPIRNFKAPPTVIKIYNRQVSYGTHFLRCPTLPAILPTQIYAYALQSSSVSYDRRISRSPRKTSNFAGSTLTVRSFARLATFDPDIDYPATRSG